MRVEPLERKDERTILCRVCWNSADDNAMLRIVVPVKASVNVYSAPVRYGDDFLMLQAPAKLPERIQKDAVKAAQAAAQKFAAIKV